MLWFNSPVWGWSQGAKLRVLFSARMRLLSFTKSLQERKRRLRRANINCHEFQDTCRLQKWEKQCFCLLGAGEHGSCSKINTAHLSGAVWPWCVHANIGALHETLRSVCIFSQSDWSKTQPLMYHFKWTQCPNENTHTYKPHLIEGYRFSHSRQFFFFSLSLFPRGKRALFEINILNLFSCKLKLPFSGWCHQGPALRDREG